MDYFSDNYNTIQYLTVENGLRKSQIGAAHSISAYFTINEKPGKIPIVVIPDFLKHKAYKSEVFHQVDLFSFPGQ